MRYLYSLIFSVFCTCLLSCTATPEGVKPASGDLLDSVRVASYSNATLTRLTTSHDSLVYTPANYELAVYRLTYRTTLRDGRAIAASGVVYIPRQLRATTKAYPLLSFQHPTAFSNAEAPSGYNFGVASFNYPLYFATHGYIVACPDYIGYGQSDQVAHPYEHGQTLAQATVDMLLATKTFLSQIHSPWTGQVFLAGYSEGGYASLSAQKLLEERYGSQFSVTGSSCGAGPYAMPAFYEHITEQTTMGGIANYLYVWETLAYNRIYNLNKPVSYYFKAPYADQIKQSVENARSIRVSFDQLCTDQFKADVRKPASDFGRALADGDLTDWKAKGAVCLIHAEQDEIIPFVTTQKTYTTMRQRGSSVNLVALKTGYHVPTEVIFMRRSLEWFERMRQ